MENEASPLSPKSFWRGWWLLGIFGLLLGVAGYSAWSFYESLDRYDHPTVQIERANPEQPPPYPIVDLTIEDLLDLPERLRLRLSQALEEAEQDGSAEITVGDKDKKRIYNLFEYGETGDPWTLVRYEGVLYSYRNALS